MTKCSTSKKINESKILFKKFEENFVLGKKILSQKSNVKSLEKVFICKKILKLEI